MSKLFFKYLSIVLICLVTIVMAGCAKTGEEKVEEFIKKRISNVNKTATYEKVEYFVNEEAHLARIKYKVHYPNYRTIEPVRYFTVHDNEHVKLIPTFDVPKKLLNKLETEHPYTFAKDVAMFNDTLEIETNLKELTEEAEKQLDRCIKADSLQLWYDYIDFTDEINKRINQYEDQLNKLPKYLNKEFMDPPKKYNVEIKFNYFYNGVFYDWFVFYD